MAGDVGDVVLATLGAWELRDRAEAEARGMTLDAYRDAEAAKVRDAELREARAKRIAPYAGLVTSADTARIVADELDTEAWKITSRWLQTESTFLVLRGGRGTGKTVAALAALARLGGRVFSAVEVVRAFRQEHEEARALRERILACRFLVLDDLGVERDKDAAAMAIQEVVNARQGGGFRTLITTNSSRKQIEDDYDSRTLERIEHGGIFYSLRGESLRTRAPGPRSAG